MQQNGFEFADDRYVKWYIYDSGEVEVVVTKLDSSVATSDYKFRLETNRSDTGFYVVTRNSQKCGSILGDTHSDWSTLIRFRVELVRCGLGNPRDARFRVTALHVPSNTIAEVSRTHPITQAWHRRGSQTKFVRSTASPSGSVPVDTTGDYAVPRVPADYYKANIINSSIDKAVDVVNRMTHGDGLKEVFISSNANVTVEVYWEGYSGTDCGPNVMACYVWGGYYPHLSEQTLWIRVPPRGFTKKGEPTAWTNDANQIVDTEDRERLVFLPNIAAHEFGHTLGLPHLPKRETHIMSEHPGFHQWAGPSLSDFNGFQQVTRPHDD